MRARDGRFSHTVWSPAVAGTTSATLHAHACPGCRMHDVAWTPGCGAMFDVVEQGDIAGAYVVRASGEFVGQVAIFLGPEAHERAKAYAPWLNAGIALQRRRTDPGFKGRTDPGR